MQGMKETIKTGFGIAIGFALFQLVLVSGIAAISVANEIRQEQ